nr:hypothetical protein [Tanacetum cinerariifolium]
MIISREEHSNKHLTRGDVVDLPGDEDPTDEDGDTEMGDLIGFLVSLGGEIFSEEKKSRESNIGGSDNTGDRVGEDGSGGSGVDAVIVLSAVDDQGGAGVGVCRQVSDNGKFLMVDEEDLIFKKISPMAKEIMVMLREDLQKI